VMPTVTVPSDSCFTHSWLSVYLRFFGMFIRIPAVNDKS
jgi:hypothetical protein